MMEIFKYTAKELSHKAEEEHLNFYGGIESQINVLKHALKV